MAVTRAEITGRVLRLLMKTADYPGFYTPQLLNDAFDEALDFVASDMFMADEGWLARMLYIDTQSNQIKVDLPISASMIREVRYQFGNIYVPMMYDSDDGANQSVASSGVTQWAYKYRILDNALYFNPPLAEGGSKFLQLEYMAWPKRLQNDTDYLDPQIDNGMQHFMKYKIASICAASIENAQRPWADMEAMWYGKMRDIIVRRNLQAQPIADFLGY